MSVDEFLTHVRFDDAGLVPVIAQQHGSGEVLMMAWSNEDTLRETLTTGRGVYYSRSRAERWAKGDTSGNTQHVRGARLDCDGDVVLLDVDQVGAACHTGTRTCFDVIALTVA
jgi:phosphoribosyl-AMP cyclohydrolase